MLLEFPSREIVQYIGRFKISAVYIAGIEAQSVPSVIGGTIEWSNRCPLHGPQHASVRRFRAGLPYWKQQARYAAAPVSNPAFKHGTGRQRGDRELSKPCTPNSYFATWRRLRR